MHASTGSANSWSEVLTGFGGWREWRFPCSDGRGDVREKLLAIRVASEIPQDKIDDVEYLRAALATVAMYAADALEEFDAENK